MRPQVEHRLALLACRTSRNVVKPTLPGMRSEHWKMLLAELKLNLAPADEGLVFLRAVELEKKGIRPITAVRQAAASLTGKTREERDLSPN